MSRDVTDFIYSPQLVVLAFQIGTEKDLNKAVSLFGTGSLRSVGTANYARLPSLVRTLEMLRRKLFARYLVGIVTSSHVVRILYLVEEGTAVYTD